MNSDTRVAGEQPFVPADDFLECRSEAKSFAVLWMVQSVFMIGAFLLLGYNRTEDPFGFAWGMPAWFLVGVLGSAVFFLLVSAVMAMRMKEVQL
tara:strand:+ start:210 stop:491 length:282 start_codon:yes stop_codon:yes gene_type:complete